MPYLNSYYFSNYFGKPLFSYEIESIANPKFECYIHSAIRFAQSGTFVGLIIGQILGFYRAYKFHAPLFRASAELSAIQGRNWMFGMLFISFPMTSSYFEFKKYAERDFYDRALRLRMSQTQLNIDRGSILSGVVFGLLLRTRKRTLFWPGFANGMCTGVCVITGYNYYMYKNEGKNQNKEQAEGEIDEMIL